MITVSRMTPVASVTGMAIMRLVLVPAVPGSVMSVLLALRRGRFGAPGVGAVVAGVFVAS